MNNTNQVSAGTLLAVLVLLAIAILSLWPSHGRSELSPRSVCAANLRGIMQSLNVYAADNNGKFPIVSLSGGYRLTSASSGAPQSTPEATFLSMYNSPPVPSIPQNLWILVLTGQVAPKQFLCRSDPGKTVNANTTTTIGTYNTNFSSDFAYSYSFAYPWKQSDGTIGDWWTETQDASLPLISDLAPLSGTGKPAATPSDPASRNANSFTHQRDGQNVAFADSHAEFQRSPNVGQNDDNIFTFNHSTPSRTGTPHNGATPQIGNGGTPGNWDVCLVPAADANHNYARK